MEVAMRGWLAVAPVLFGCTSVAVVDDGGPVDAEPSDTGEVSLDACVPPPLPAATARAPACDAGCEVADTCTFADPVLESIVRAAAGLPDDGSAIRPVDLDGLTELAASAFGVASLDGIACARDLEVVSLTDGDYTDLAPLACLPALRELNVDRRETYTWTPPPIASIEALSCATALEVLELGDAGTDDLDLSPLAGLVRLRQVDIGTLLEEDDVAVLGGLASLQDLSLWELLLPDLSALAGATSLTSVTLYYTGVDDLAPALSWPRLSHLNVYGSGVTDLSPLRNATCLRTLDVSATPVDDLSALEGLPLEGLGISYTRVTDPSPIATLSQLTALHAGGLGLGDLDFLAGLSRLESVSVPVNAIEDTDGLADAAALRSIELFDNPVTDLSGLAHKPSLAFVGLAATDVADLGPLSDATSLDWLHLTGAEVSDLRPLVDNPGVGEGDDVLVYYTNVDCGSAEVAELVERGVNLSGC